jgi:hypothetical protein
MRDPLPDGRQLWKRRNLQVESFVLVHDVLPGVLRLPLLFALTAKVGSQRSGIEKRIRLQGHLLRVGNPTAPQFRNVTNIG